MPGIVQDIASATNPLADLEIVVREAKAAIQAIVDEHEGNCKEAVDKMFTASMRVTAMVGRW